MVSTFISPVISRAAELGVSSYEDTKPAESSLNDSLETVEIVIRASLPSSFGQCLCNGK